MLVVDDTLFVRDFFLGSVRAILERNASALGVSLRLGDSIEFCQPLNSRSYPPRLDHLEGAGPDELLLFRWVGESPDWGYPLELSSSVYRRHEFAKLVRGFEFDSPTLLEHQLWQQKNRVSVDQPYLVCYRKPRSFSLPLNRVQTIASNPALKDDRYSTDRLLSLYSDGWRIDVAAYDGYIPHACHETPELLLCRLNDSRADD
jgi:hypothetical protein